VKDRVAIAGVGVAPYRRGPSTRSLGDLVLTACIEAIEDAGLTRDDIDGLCGSTVRPAWVQSALGLHDATWFAHPPIPIGNQLVAAAHAVHAGACRAALVYHSTYVDPSQSGSAAADPFRVRSMLGRGSSQGLLGTGHYDTEPAAPTGQAAYAAWAGRYYALHATVRERVALVAINARAHAADNENAVLRDPLTVEQYLGGPMVRDPLCLYDVEVAVDGADAFVLTSTERARDLRHPLVMLHAATLGLASEPDELATVELDRTGQQVVMEALWRRADLSIADVDVFYPYDGFTFLVLCWMEAAGLCGPGEAPDLVAQSWDLGLGRIMLGGRVPLNTHGGSLAEGGTHGAGALREAVHQLRGRAGPRQVRGAKVALITPGGLFHNAQGALLRAG